MHRAFIGLRTRILPVLGLGFAAIAGIASAAPQRERVNVADSAHFQKALSGGEAVIGRSVLSGATGRWFKALIGRGGAGSVETPGEDEVQRILSLARFAETPAGPIYAWVGVPKASVMVHAERDPRR